MTQLDAVLSSIMVKRMLPGERRSKHLCLDPGYRGATALSIILGHGYIPHVASRADENDAKKRHPGRKARRWIVEVCHSWFNRFRKLLVRYEKLERSFLALKHLAAAIIAFRKVHLKTNIIGALQRVAVLHFIHCVRPPVGITRARRQRKRRVTQTTIIWR